MMTRKERIELLQDQAQHQRIAADDLRGECKKYKIELYDEVLEPIGFNTCDRCGKYGDNELDFIWVDFYPWEEDNENDKKILKAISQEGADYCALCWGCIEELKKEGI